MPKVNQISPPLGVDSATDAIDAPATKATDAVHADYLGNNASNDFPGPFTNPDVSRNATVTFEGGWTGGNVTVAGLDQFGAAVSEIFVSNPGTTVVGVKVFAVVSAATKGAVGVAKKARIGTGDKLGLSSRLGVPCGSLAVDAVNEVGAWDSTYHAVAPTTPPNGARVFSAFYPVA